MDIVIKKDTPLKEFNHHWKFCVGSAHAIYALRHDYVNQLKELSRDLGIERVRFHGIFDDSMHTVVKMADIIPLPFSGKYTEKSFRQCANVYDNIIEAGMKPFVELSFMPKHLAKFRLAKGMFYYRPIVSMPRLLSAWEDYIRSFIRFLIDRYGKEEVETWCFEVWNEPDIPVVFFNGTQKDYFRLYTATVNAIKSIDNNIKVGGPATSGSKWIKDFITYCEGTNTPFDFISTHQYAGDPIGGIENKEQGLGLKMNFLAGFDKTISKDNILDLYRSFMGVADAPKSLGREALTESAKNVKALAGEKPVYYTEWNMCASFSAPCNDTSMQAAYILHAISGSQGSIDGSSIWCFSDLFEEFHQFPEEFHGGFGLMTQSGIKKPAYYALQFLNEAGNMAYEIPHNDKIDVNVFKKDNEINIIISMLDFDEQALSENVNIKMELDCAPAEVYENNIDETHCNPLKEWESFGKPQMPQPSQLKAIISASAPTDEATEYEYKNNIVTISTCIKSNAVKRIVIKQ